MTFARGEGAGPSSHPEIGVASSQLYAHCLPVTMLCLFDVMLYDALSVYVRL